MSQKATKQLQGSCNRAFFFKSRVMELNKTSGLRRPQFLQAPWVCDCFCSPGPSPSNPPAHHSYKGPLSWMVLSLQWGYIHFWQCFSEILLHMPASMATVITFRWITCAHHLCFCHFWLSSAAHPPRGATLQFNWKQVVVQKEITHLGCTSLLWDPGRLLLSSLTDLNMMIWA